MRTSLAALVFILSFPLLGQVPPVLSQQIVVTASSVPEDAGGTPASVTVIDKEEIAAQEARDVADLLREVAGLTISRSGSGGKSTSLFTRGASSTQTLVLWNGMEINNPYFAGYDWGRFSTAGVERVEIVRGPYSALYGSDAIGGVVNILTVPSASSAALDVESGQNGLLNGVLSASQVWGALAASASVERREDDGWSPNDDFSQDSSSLSLQWQRGGLTVGAHGRHTSYELGIPMNQNAAGTELVPSLARRQNGTESQILLPVTWQWGRAAIRGKISESRRDDEFEDPEDPFGYTFGSTSSTTRRTDLSLQLDAGGLGTIVTGGEWERALVDDRSSFGVSLDGESRTSRAAFIEDRLTHPLSAAARIEASVGIRRDTFDTFGGATSPRAAIALVRGGTKLRAAWGEAFRAPSIGELYFPWSGNAALEPEESRSWEVGIDRDVVPGGRVSITFFDADYRNLIVFDNASYRFENLGGAISRGIELSATGAVSRHVAGSAAWTRLQTRENATGLPLLRRPRNSGSVTLACHERRYRCSATLLYTGARADVLPVTPYSRVVSPAVTTADAMIGIRVRAVEPYLKVENLTGERYQEVFGFPSPGRRVILGVRVAR